METEKARLEFPIWANKTTEGSENMFALPGRIQVQTWMERVKRRYGILIIAAALFTLYTIALSAWVHYHTEKEIRLELAMEYSARLEAYKTEQEQAQQAARLLSGADSLEAFIQQEITAGAKLICQEANDQVKGTKLGVALARVMNKAYPGTIQEVAAQENQFMFYSEDNKVTEHDLQLAEKILRPYYEQGIVPNGLTAEMVYFEWNGSTGTARDSYQTTTSMSTWRWNG